MKLKPLMPSRRICLAAERFITIFNPNEENHINIKFENSVCTLN